MSSIRLTNEMRRSICKAVLASAFDKREEKLRDDANKLAARVLKHVLGPKLHKALLELPKGWEANRDDVKVSLAGCIVSFDCDDYAVPHNKNGFTVLGIIDRRDALCVPIEEHIFAMRECATEKGRRKVEIEAVLQSTSTIAKLIDVWPEVKPFVPSSTFIQIDRTVPVVQIQALNTALGLGKRRRAA